MPQADNIRVAVVGYGVIGKRVAAGVALQDDMTLVGVADVATDWRLHAAIRKGVALYGATAEAAEAMDRAGLPVAGGLDALVGAADVVVDCTPKHVGAANAELYRRTGKPFIVQGGEKHAVTGHSFVAESSYAGAVGRPATRVVSCNTTSIVRTLTALKRAGLLRRARGTLLRRATDPWESDHSGIMNTLVPEPEIPSHQGPDAQSVDPALDVVTMAVKVPETIAHLHYWSVQMTRAASKDEVIAAFLASSRIAPIQTSDGLVALNTVKEMMADLGRPHDNLYEVALWTDMLKVQGDELFYAYMVDNQAIVIPETLDAVRALSGRVDAAASIAKTDASLGVGELIRPRPSDRTGAAAQVRGSAAAKS
ncbi:type II glyceraldehyde-3-phosphate dehydrogenase [Phenylobacterium soli]|uniref:Type II glyceraldehyde-3-phosphate dehydrogenase n=1 Tax=Phenylobacterium soli TaxID=2170551 RepID=A0A328AHY1_9CAUL|nr:type II glyceraldehyde-3-phosphate dehydrogenase [Phenylobacterium soli]RAK54127.1 type II glyceraldehyde-3-phosphate dehydrogenase [Phenylobacterium soli]